MSRASLVRATVANINQHSTTTIPSTVYSDLSLASAPDVRQGFWVLSITQLLVPGEATTSIMPFRGLFSSGNVEASSSRKRSYAEVDRSESRSQSPQHPSSKRRRIGTTTTPSTSIPRHRSTSTQTFTPRSDHMARRFESDGFDYRRPVMSTSSGTQTAPTVIDLTDEDSNILPNDLGRDEIAMPRISTWPDITTSQQARNRGPRFGRDIIAQNTDELEVIDLVDSDDTEEFEREPSLNFDEDLFSDPVEASSPDVTFVSERPAPTADIERAPSRTNRRLPTPPDRRSTILNPFSTLRDFVRRSGNHPTASGSDLDDAREALDRETLDRIDGIREGRNAHHNRFAEAAHTLVDLAGERSFRPFGNFPVMAPLHAGSADFSDIIDVDGLEMTMDLDYGHAAFEVVDQDRPEIIDPPLMWPAALNHRRGEDPAELVKEPYNRPEQSKEGFTMNFEEDDQLVCPSCGDELSLGDEGSVKAQVWMVKGCGHVYCGHCTANRKSTKRKGKAAQKVETTVVKPFKTCLVQGCGKSVSGATTMFQAYL